MGTPLLVLLPFVFSLLHIPVIAHKKSYIVYMGGHPNSKGEISLEREKVITDSHHEILSSVVGSKEMAKDAIFYSYTKYINGFAANLDEESMTEISRFPEVVSVFENKAMELHTTHSWSFLQLERDGLVPKKSLWSKARFGEDAIIGNIDTGVWPESDSFSDEGMGPIPSRWRGVCQESKQGAPNVRCNKKLIGARYFNQALRSSMGIELDAAFYTARDHEGHGTHTLSTSGGSPVPSASVFGYGNGTARGGSPSARVAAYKACFPQVEGSQQCYAADILAAFEAAIEDGVDVISLSLGGMPDDYFPDSIAIGSFHAVDHGIVVVALAGNHGPEAGKVENVAPWIITVGASSLDRKFASYLKLGNGRRLTGQSLSPDALHDGMYPLIEAEQAVAAYTSLEFARLCLPRSLDPEKVKGKIVVCQRGEEISAAKSMTVSLCGGAGMVLVDRQGEDSQDVAADLHFVPTTHINHAQSLQLFDYMRSTKNPVGYITKAVTKVGTKPAPSMADFSSRGPNAITPEILKPDVTAPGVAVIAAFPDTMAPSYLPNFDNRRVKFNVMSGTSMSCPHVAGVVGLLKTLHPHWSPAAIKSAIMTSAKIRDNTGGAMLDDASHTRASPFSYGTGHIVPNRAMDPGLIYDAAIVDYIRFLCSIGYNSTQVKMVTSASHTCPSSPASPSDLNYRSIAVPSLSHRATIRRRVRNVGTTPVTYKVKVVPPRGVKVRVVPKRLRFKKSGEEKEFTVRLKVERESMVEGEYVFGGIIWSDGVHHVRSPLVVRATRFS